MKYCSARVPVGLCLVLFTTACDRYGGNIIGAAAIQESTVQACFVFQFDTYQERFDASKRRPLFAIVWQATRVGTTSSSDRGLVNSIHMHPIAPSRKHKAVYCLQPDYSLKALSLTNDEIDTLFALVSSDSSTTSGMHLTFNSIWQQKVQPFLKVVEPLEK